MDALRAKNISKQAYIDRVVKSHLPHARIGEVVIEGTWIGADILRHTLMLSGVVGLVTIAVGAITDCNMYWSVLGWVSSLFVGR